MKKGIFFKNGQIEAGYSFCYATQHGEKVGSRACDSELL